jgi:hypothetical protein
MRFSFSSGLPTNFSSVPLVISGHSSFEFDNSEYLVVEDANDVTVFEIKYKYHCSPFKQAALINQLLLAGHECHFYLYDLLTNKNVLTLEMSGYFGHFYFYKDLIYVADANSLTCLNKEGNVFWKNSGLGIDGVIVQKFDDDKIYGSGEFDPPGGWSDFVLDLKTGKKVKEFAD